MKNFEFITNLGVVQFKDKAEINGNFQIEDNYNISDEDLLKRIKYNV